MTSTGSNERGRTELAAAVTAHVEDSASIVSGSAVGVNGVAVPLLLVDARRAARLLSVSAGTVRNLMARGELRPVRVGRRVLFSVEELRRFIASRTGGAA